MSLLELRGVSRSFGGVRAVDDVSLDVDEGEIVGLIGPNGAGKTTLFNVVSGIHRPQRGSLRFAGTDITRWGLPDRARLGIGRTFQTVRPFGSMTVLDNVTVPRLVAEPNVSAARRAAAGILDELGLADLADSGPDELTLAQRKRIEVARALATEPRLLLLDEVLAGLNSTEINEALPLVRTVADRGVTVFMIEHLMSAVMTVSQRVVVMDRGSVIASGTPTEITSNERVIEAYLGRETSDADG